MATGLVKKLGIGDRTRLALLDAPEDFENTLGKLPSSVTVRRSLRGPLDIIVTFFDSRSRLERRIAALSQTLTPSGGLWIAWPKRTAGMQTDLTDRRVRAIGLAAGLVDNKVCAIDATWSGLRFVRRLEDRAGAGSDRPGPGIP